MKKDGAMKRDPNGMSHEELITALDDEFTGIIGFAELLMGDDERSNRQAAEVLAAAERALEISRALARRLNRVLRARECRLNDEIRAVQPALHRIAGRDVEILLRLAPDVGSVALARDDLERFLKVAVAESTQAMGAAGCITIRTIAVSRANRGSKVRLMVEDSTREVATSDARQTLASQDRKSPLTTLERQAAALQEAGAKIRFSVDSGYGTTLTVDFPVQQKDS